VVRIGKPLSFIDGWLSILKFIAVSPSSPATAERGHLQLRRLFALGFSS
jgi:hypothetical protein